MEGMESFEAVLSEMRVQNSNILSTQGATNAILTEHGEKFERIFDTLKKINKDIDGNGDYKNGMRYRHDELCRRLDAHIAAEALCPGRDTEKIDAKLTEMSSMLETIKSMNQFKAGEVHGRREANNERRAKMNWMQKAWDIFLEAPARSVGFALLSLALVWCLNFIGCHKQAAAVKPILEHGQTAVDNGGSK